MSCIHPADLRSAEVNRVSSLEILERFRDQHKVLLALALIIRGNIRDAEGAVCKARELMTNWVIPFVPPEQLTKWVRWVTIKAAVADSLHDISCI